MAVDGVSRRLIIAANAGSVLRRTRSEKREAHRSHRTSEADSVQRQRAATAAIVIDGPVFHHPLMLRQLRYSPFRPRASCFGR